MADLFLIPFISRLLYYVMVWGHECKFVCLQWVQNEILSIYMVIAKKLLNSNQFTSQ